MKNIEAPLITKWSLDLGAAYLGGGETTFRVWAPYYDTLTLELDGRIIPLEKQERGYFFAQVDNTAPQALYTYRLPDGRQLPDPVSRSLPQGVHGPSQIIDPNAYTWHDHTWKSIELSDAIIYEIHVATFTQEGTFDGVINKLDYLLDLGITMIEIMPIAEFPGRWSWGYDGIALFAPAKLYGGVEGFKRLVDSAHQKGIAVCLDVVYNHLGPEGNYLAPFAPYFSEKYHTPWGETFNLDEAGADEVRNYLMANARYWAEEYHVDALRLDAIHGIFDFSAQQMLPLLVDELPIPLIAESALNDSFHVRPKKVGGANLAAVWNDDFHHALHVALTKESVHYYQDYNGCRDLAKVVEQGFLYNGCYSKFRKLSYGNDATDVPYNRFVVYAQNHDQAGNRPQGERLTTLTSEQKCEATAYLTLMSPFIPMLFMGEEYGEKNPFQYFVDFSNPELMDSIVQGRQAEFSNQVMPYPGQEAFERSKLSWNLKQDRILLYKKLIALRKEYAPKKDLTIGEVYSYSGEQWVAWEYQTIQGIWIALFCNLGSELKLKLPFQHISQNKVLLASQEISIEQEISLTSPFSLLLI